jgi:fatty-acyl-CoA synthase
MAMGDLGHLDSDGRLFIEGRVDRMIVSGGENVFPEEVERLLMTHPAISDVVVVPVEDPEYGERLRALVVAETILPTEELKAFVSQGLSRAKVPRDFLFVDELPRSAMGKVTKSGLAALEEQLSAHEGENVTTKLASSGGNAP